MSGTEADEGSAMAQVHDGGETRKHTRDSWLDSDLNVSVESDHHIHHQIKQGILGLVENELRTERTEGSPKSSGIERKEKKSPSKRRKKRSKHRADSEFDISVSSLSALERVDAYLKEYNKAEEVTLSGELEIDPNDLVNNNGSSKESKLKPRKTRRKSRHEDGKRSSSSRDISPRVFDPATGKLNKSPNTRLNRPTLDLTSMLDDLGSDVISYHERHIDNPFSSPSPMTSPNDGTLERSFGTRPEKIYIQRGGTFRAVTRERMLGENQRRLDEGKYFRLSSLTPLDVAITVQGGWRGMATLCHGLLAGLALMHMLSVCYGDGTNPGHLSFHSVIILPYSAAYYFLCACCMVSVFDSLDINGVSYLLNIRPHLKGILLSLLYVLCMLITLSSRRYDEMIAFQFDSSLNSTTDTNSTALSHTAPEFYSTWSQLSIWRGILPVLAAIFVAFSRQEDILYRDLVKLLQFKHSLQSIGG